MLRLIPMSQSEFDAYLGTAVADYAQAHAKAGDCEPEKALELAQQDYQSLLPDGLQSHNQFLFSAVDETGGGPRAVGLIWFAVKDKPGRKTAFIYDFRIADEFQGQGHGKEMMMRFEEVAKEMGISKSSLHVFGFNVAARHLYEKMGYQVVSIAMIMKIPPPRPKKMATVNLSSVCIGFTQ